MSRVIDSQVLNYFVQPSTMTSIGERADALADVPTSLEELTSVIHGLVVYDIVAADFYGFEIPPSRRDEIHLRPVKALIDHLLDLDDRTLGMARAVERRLVGRCHHFAVLLTAMLRHQGVPARTRCGFGAYFNPGHFEDHWVCEAWRESEQRWVVVDPQLDKVWQDRLGIHDDVLDLPRDQFIVAAEAWTRCRQGAVDPARFGISFAELNGLWYVAGNLVRDLAALNKVEVLPWDVWGCQPQPGNELTSTRLGFFDELASVMRDPDLNLADLRARYDDDWLRVPGEVFNAVRRQPEKL